MSLKMNGELRQAKQYRRLSKEVEVKSKRGRATEVLRNAPNVSRSAPASEEQDTITPSHGEDEGKTSVSDWSWEPSEHEGLLTYHDSRKRWYHCLKCEYFNDRLYHSKMHYERIHVKNGKSMPRKRKYPNSSNVSVSKDISPIPKSAGTKSVSKNAARSSMPANRGSPTKKYQNKTTDESMSGGFKSADREALWKNPSDMLVASSVKDGRWTSANAKILTFGDGSYNQKAGQNCIGSGLSLTVSDLKAPTREKIRTSDVRSECLYEEPDEDDEDDFETREDASCSEQENDETPPVVEVQRPSRSLRKKKFRIYTLPSSTSVLSPTPSIIKASATISAIRRSRVDSAMEGDDQAENHESDTLLPHDSYTEEEPPEEVEIEHRKRGIAVGAPPLPPPLTGGGKSAATGKLMSPVSSPQIQHNVLRPRTDNSVAATPVDSSSCRLVSFLSTPHDDFMMRTPTRPADMLPSTPSFGSPEGRRLRPRHALPGLSSGGGASGREGGVGHHGFGTEVDPSKLATPVWDALVCTENIESCHLFVAEDVTSMYDWSGPS